MLPAGGTDDVPRAVSDQRNGWCAYSATTIAPGLVYSSKAVCEAP